MTRHAPDSNRWRAIACLSCILVMQGLSAMAQNAAPAVPPKPRKIINYGGRGWKDAQVQEPCVLVNPKDSNKLIMFYSGMTRGGNICIGKAWADVSDPFGWHEDADNPILKSDPNKESEGGALRLDSVIYNKSLDEYWIYYTGGRVNNSIHLATCPAGSDGYREVVTAKIQRYKDNPVLTPRGQGRDDGDCVSQGAVFVEKGLWYMFYSYRNGTKVLPGIRLATSHDGQHWTKRPGADLLAAAPEQVYIEWHQVYKIGNLYVLLYEGYNGGVRWGADVATSSDLTKGWRKAPLTLIDQTKWPNYSVETMFHVATPAIYNVNNNWYMYFQGARAGEYSIQNWALWGIRCDDVVKNLADLDRRLSNAKQDE